MAERPDEIEIVHGLQRGCVQAWDALCQRYGERLWRLVARLIGRNEAAVGDVFQETMLAVARAGRGLSDDTHLWGWLSTIAHRQAALHWRQHYRDLEREAPDDVSLLDETTQDPLEQDELRRGVRHLLAELESADAVVLIAKYMDGLSVKEIVKLHGGTVESVRSRLARARRQFRERFARASLP